MIDKLNCNLILISTYFYKLSFQASKIMEATDIFDVSVSHQWACTNENHMPNYIIIIGWAWEGYKDNVVSYSSLLDVVNNKLLPCFKLENRNSSALKFEPIEFNQKYNLTKSMNSCVSHVAFCLFPYQCIISIKTDPLLVGIKQFYDKLLNDFHYILPGNQQNSNSSIKNIGSFRISKPYCYKYGECFGIEPMSRLSQFLARKSFIKMRKTSKALLKLKAFNDLNNKTTCDPFVFICHVSGICNTFFFSELDNEFGRGINYLFGLNKILTSKICSRQTAYLNKIAELHKNSTECNPIYIYGDVFGLFHVHPSEYNALLTLLNRHNAFFKYFIHTFASPIMNLREPEFYSNSTLQAGFSVHFKNKLIKYSRGVGLKVPLEGTRYIVRTMSVNIPFFKQSAMHPPINETKNQQSKNFKTSQIEDDPMLDFIETFNVYLETDVKKVNPASQNILKAESETWHCWIIASGLIIFGLILLSLKLKNMPKKIDSV